MCFQLSEFVNSINFLIQSEADQEILMKDMSSQLKVYILRDWKNLGKKKDGGWVLHFPKEPPSDPKETLLSIIQRVKTA